jgi:hypothetical protein
MKQFSPNKGVRFISALLIFLAASASASDANTIASKWVSASLQETRESKVGAPMVARALAIVNTCMYEAWAAYDDKVVGTQLGDALRPPKQERTEANKSKAISYAAYRALSDLFPADVDTIYKPLMRQLGYNPDDNSTDIETPQGIGNVACAAVLEFRHHDNSNQLGDLAQGQYADWSGYVPKNKPTAVPASVAMNDPAPIRTSR